jgi:hypothetical protein
MAGPWGVLPSCPTAATTDVGDVDGGPLGVLPVAPRAPITEVEDNDGGPPGGAAGMSDSAHD